jgi:hypothetical protein
MGDSELLEGWENPEYEKDDERLMGDGSTNHKPEREGVPV